MEYTMEVLKYRFFLFKAKYSKYLLGIWPKPLTSERQKLPTIAVFEVLLYELIWNDRDLTCSNISEYSDVRCWWFKKLPAITKGNSSDVDGSKRKEVSQCPGYPSIRGSGCDSKVEKQWQTWNLHWSSVCASHIIDSWTNVSGLKV